jgi:uncharacterized protein (TIGR03118 family)
VIRHFAAAGFAIALALSPAVTGENAFVQHNLVSDLPGLADHTDPHLQNPWGIAESAQSAFWIVNNKSGFADIYDGSGKPSPLEVPVPAAGGAGAASPTGQVFNPTNGFVLNGAKPALFLFCTEDGTISGWYGGIENNKAQIAVDRSGTGAVYKGLALGVMDSGPVLYAANFSAGTVDVFSGDFSMQSTPGAFADPDLPPGFAPFNIYVASGKVYVAYAMQDEDKEDDLPGEGNGYVDVFDLNGAFIKRLISGGKLNSPWGMAIAPEQFGDFGNALLVGNFGDGTINAFDASTGEFVGTLKNASGEPIVNLGLWALQFGNGAAGGDTHALYFTAGISGPDAEPVETHGLFGSIQAAPIVDPGGVVNAAGYQPVIAGNTWVSIFGKNLAATTRAWQASDFTDNRLPTELDHVSVKIDGNPAYVAYVSPTQINVLTRVDLRPGDVAVEVTSNGLAGQPVTANSQQVSPALFQIGKYALATHADNTTPVGPIDSSPGALPAKPGETIVLYGAGFGNTSPGIAEGEVVTSPAQLANPAGILIGGAPAQILFQGLTSTGVYQFNVVVPDGIPSGDAAIAADSLGQSSPANVFTSVDSPAPAPVLDSTGQIENFKFEPNPIEVSSGGKVTWTNKQGVAHTIVSDNGEFQSQVLGQNGTFAVTFATKGTHAYHCSIHPFMKGQVVVQ